MGPSNAPSRLTMAVTTTNSSLERELSAIVGEANCIVDPGELRTYECDGLTGYARASARRRVARVHRGRRRRSSASPGGHGLPIVPRGAGTGLSGGALPVDGLHWSSACRA